MRKRCSKGKSCGATCIDPRERCVLELGPLISSTIKKARRLISLDREEFIKGMKEMGAGSLSADKGARDLFPSDPKSLPSDLKAALKALPPPPTTTSEVRGDIARLIKEASASPSVPTPIKLSGASSFSFTPSELEKLRQMQELQFLLPPVVLEGRQLSRPPERSRQISMEVRKDISNISKRLDTAGLNRIKDKLGVSATGNTRWAREDAKDSDLNLGKVLRVGDKKYDGWKDSYGKGSTKIGEGAYGTVIRNPDNTFVKRGAVSSTEAQIMDRLGKVDLGPKLIAADINGIHQFMAAPGVSTRDGRIAMTGVKGEPMGTSTMSFTKFNGEYAPNVYWKAMAGIHRLGIAHNDAHPGNIMVDDKGKGRWVDLGLAQSSPKAALAEALGAFKGPTGKGGSNTMPSENSSLRAAPNQGNWQTRRWLASGIMALERSQNDPAKLAEYRKDMPVVAKILDNQSRVNEVLKTKYKLDDKDIETLYKTSIRSPISSYNKGVWGKLTDSQAQDLINQMYEGV